MACVVAGESPAQSSVPGTSAGRVTAQLVGGVVVTPLSFFGAGYAAKRVAAGMGASPATASQAGYIAAYTGLWIGAAAVPAGIGQGGSLGAALAGSAGGMVVSWGAVKLGNRLYDGGRRRCGPFCLLLGAVSVAGAATGATLAYNVSR
ncbi:MAG: hypothetical protein ACT4OZ_08310 [Gemmatimonadota bacterium]